MNKVVGIIIAAVVTTSMVAAQRGGESSQPAAQGGRPPSLPIVALPDVVLLLPGPFATCAPTIKTDGSR